MKIEKMTIPPFLQLEIKLSEPLLNNQRKISKEIREEIRRENRSFLKKKIESFIQNKPPKHKTPNIIEKKENNEVI